MSMTSRIATAVAVTMFGAFAALPLVADTETVGGYTWTYRINGNAAEIGDGINVAVSSSPSGALIIPSELGGQPVTSIGSLAFFGCSGLTCVTIPNSVKSIGDGAFEGCSSLTNLTIPNGVMSIGAITFDRCSSLASVTIPESVTNIGYSAFSYCDSLANVTIPSNVVSIGDESFCYCHGLASVTIPSSVTSIGSAAFFYCDGLTNVTFEGDAPATVGMSAFECVSSNCVAYVHRGSTGWGVDIPGTWNGMRIEYLPGGESVFDGWNVTVATNAYWSESFPATYAELQSGAWPLYQPFESSVSPNTAFSVGHGQWVNGCYRDNNTGMSFQMEGNGRGFVQFIDAYPRPQGVESVSFSARVAQRVSFDGFAWYYGGLMSLPDNYTFMTAAAFDFNSRRAFAGNASLSLVAFYMPEVGCYELRVEQENALVSAVTGEVTGPGSTFRISLYKWAYSPEDGRVVPSLLGTTTHANGNNMFNTTNENGTYGRLFISVDTSVEGETRVVGGVARTSVSRTGFFNSSSYREVMFRDTADNRLLHGTFGLGSANCPARFVQPSYAVSPVAYQATKMGFQYGIYTLQPISPDYRVGCMNDIASGGWTINSSRMEPFRVTDSDRYGIAALVPTSSVSVYTAPAGATNGWTLLSTSAVNGFGSSASAGELATIPVYSLEPLAVMITASGAADVTIDDIELRQFCGESYTSPGQSGVFADTSYGSPTNVVFTQGRVVDRGGEGKACILSAKRTRVAAASSIRSPLMVAEDGVTGLGLGSVSFSYVDAQPNALLLVQIATNGVSLSNLAALTASASGWPWDTVASVNFSGMTAAERASGTLHFDIDVAGVMGVMRVVVAPARVAAVADVTNPRAFGEVTITDIAFRAAEGNSVMPQPIFTIVDGVLTAVDLNGATEVVIPDGVTSIGEEAFFFCSDLTSVTIPDSVMSIGPWAFANCQGLTSVTIGNGVISIGTSAFHGCDGLVSVMISASVTSIDVGAFTMCCGLMAFTVADENPSYKSEAGLLLTKDGKVLVAAPGGLTDVSIPDGVESIGASAFEYTCFTNVTIPASVTNIEDFAFCNCMLTSVTIPSSVTSIGEGVFSSCCELTSVTIPSGVTSIGDAAFEGCCELTSVTMPASVTSIGDYAFSGCGELESVTIPSCVTSIGEYAFFWCDGLTNMVFEGNAPVVGEDAFDSVSDECVVYVHRGSTGWGVEMPGEWQGVAIRYIEDGAPLVATHTVTFDLGGYGTRIGGGELVQSVTNGCDAVAPEVSATDGWMFTGWDVAFTNVTSNLAVTAQYEQQPAGVVSGNVHTVTFVCSDDFYNGQLGNEVYLNVSGDEYAGSVQLGSSIEVDDHASVEMLGAMLEAGLTPWYGEYSIDQGSLDDITCDITVTIIPGERTGITMFVAGLTLDSAGRTAIEGEVALSGTVTVNMGYYGAAELLGVDAGIGARIEVYGSDSAAGEFVYVTTVAEPVFETLSGESAAWSATLDGLGYTYFKAYMSSPHTSGSIQADGIAYIESAGPSPQPQPSSTYVVSDWRDKWESGVPVRVSCGDRISFSYDISDVDDWTGGGSAFIVVVKDDEEVVATLGDATGDSFDWVANVPPGRYAIGFCVDGDIEDGYVCFAAFDELVEGYGFIQVVVVSDSPSNICYTVETRTGEYEFFEGDRVSVRIQLDAENTQGDIYAYIRGETETAMAAIDCAWKAQAGGRGLRLSSYATTTPAPKSRFTLLDGCASPLGSTYAYAVVFLTQDTWTDDPSARVTAYRQRAPLVINVSSVAPPPVEIHTVTFDLGAYGTRTGGGELVQMVTNGCAAVAPAVAANQGWELTGWSPDVAAPVSADTTFTAQYAQLPFWSGTEVVDGLTWHFAVSNGVASITDSNEFDGMSAGCAVSGITDGNVVVPSRLGGCTVVSIAADAFVYCLGLRSITIPASVMRIGSFAFYSCTNLVDVTMSEGVVRIDDGAFFGCIGLGEIVIPSSVAVLGSEAFWWCQNLTNICLEGNAPEIGYLVGGYDGSAGDTPFGGYVDGQYDVRCGMEAGSCVLHVSASSTGWDVPVNGWTVEPGKWMGLPIVREGAVAAVHTVTFVCSDDFYNGQLGNEVYLNVSGDEYAGSVQLGSSIVVDDHATVEILGAMLDAGLTAWSGEYSIDRGSLEDVTCDITVTLSPGERSGIATFVTGFTLDSAELTENDGEVALSGTVVGTMGGYGMADFLSVGAGIGASIEVYGSRTATGEFAYLASVAEPVFEALSGESTAWSATFDGQGYTFFKVEISSPHTSGHVRADETATLCEELVLRSVTFDLGEHGARVGGGELVQSVTNGCDAVAPEVSATAGWMFTGWDAAFTNVTADLTVTAMYEPVAHTVNFTLAWPTTLTSVYYMLDGVDCGWMVPTNGIAVISGTNGASVTLVGSLGYATRTVTGTITDDGMLALPAVDIGYYFPMTMTPGQDGTSGHPYEIANAAGLFALQDAAAAGLGLDLFYVQRADIDMSGAGPFAGIGVYDSNPTNGMPFTGTYNGYRHRISNVDFTQRSYGGIFNQVSGGRIINLTVENITCSTFDSAVNDGAWGCAIVGNAGNGALLGGLVAKGSFGSGEIPCTHDVAGIAVRLSGGTTNVTSVISCTNNATLYGSYARLGGICAITQRTFGRAPVHFSKCANVGEIVALDPWDSGITGSDGIAGIVAYSADNTRLTRCSSIGNVYLHMAAPMARIGELVGGLHPGSQLSDGGGNSCNASMRMVGDASFSSNFRYALVLGGMATTVNELAGNMTYLLEGYVTASETPVFTLMAPDEFITFDVALGYGFNGTVAAADGLGTVCVTNGTCITYTAVAAPQILHTVTFDLGAHGTRTGGGELVQSVTNGYDAVAPTVRTEDGWLFEGWDAAFTSVTSDISVNALYSRMFHDITVRNPDGSVAVTNVEYGTQLRFVAPEPLVDDLCRTQIICRGTSYTSPTVTNEVVITVTNAISFVWDIVETNYWLEIETPTNGMVADGETGWMDANLQLNLTAVPDAHYHFVKWTGDLVGNDLQNGAGQPPAGLPVFETSNPLMVIMDRSRTIGVEFEIDVHEVTFALGSHGSRTGGGELVQAVTNGCSAIAPTVAADFGWLFAGWSTPLANITDDVTIFAQYESAFRLDATNAMDGVAYEGTFCNMTGMTDLTWSASGLPEGLTLSADGTISGTVLTTGAFRFYVTVSAPNGASRTIPVSIYVAENPNHRPVVSGTSPAAAASAPLPLTLPGDTLSFGAEASDPDGDALSYVWLVDGVTNAVTTAGTFLWTPGELDGGTRTVTCLVTDGFWYIPAGSGWRVSIPKWYVSADGDSSNAGTTTSAPFREIQSAVDAAAEGDVIFVAEGVYSPVNTANKKIRVIATGALDKTIVDGAGTSRCVFVGEEVSATNSWFVGLTIRNGAVRDYGAGACGGRFDNCVIENCASAGSYYGGGAYRAILNNCLVRGNSARNGAGAAFGVVNNCTVVRNASTSSGGGTAYCKVSNSIVWDNTNGGYNHYSNCWEGTLNYSCTTRSTSGTGNICVDPYFTDPANGDYRLRQYSPCLDAGNNAYVVGDSDLSGTNRVIDGAVDMGCYEGWVPLPKPSAIADVAAEDGVQIGVVRLTWAADELAKTYAIYRAETNIVEAASQIGASAALFFNDETATPETTYWYWVTGVNPAGEGAPGAGDSGWCMAPVAIGTNGIAAAMAGVPYRESIAVSGGSGRYTWRISAEGTPAGQSIPTGLAIGGDGVLSGTMNIAGAYMFTVFVTDEYGNGATRQVSLVVEENPDMRTVAFNLGEHGVRSGGGDLLQYVLLGGSATAPTVRAHTGWVFDGWTGTFTNIADSVTASAKYRSAYADLHVEEVSVRRLLTAALPDGETGGSPSSATVAATAGDTLSVSWTVGNAGNPPFAGKMTEYVRFIDAENPSNVMVVATLPFDGTIARDGTVERSAEVALPPKGMEGAWIVEVETAVDPSVREYTGNNTGRGPMVTVAECPLPDIAVVGVTADPTSFMPGDTVTVEYVVANIGAAGVATNWLDRIALEDSSGKRVNLKTVAACDVDVTNVIECVVPELVSLAGDVRFVVETDFDDDVVEVDDVANNTARSEVCALGRRLYLASASDSVYENVSGSGVRFTVRRSGPTTEALTVALGSSDATSASLPATVTIPSGSVSTVFYVKPIDNATVEGPRMVMVSASAGDCRPASLALTILDNEVPHIYLALDKTSIREGDGVILATVTRELVTDEPLTVYLSGTSGSRVSYPASVVIPAGEASVTVEISVPNNDTAQAAASLTLRASASGYTSTSVSYTVEDDDVPGVTISLAPEVVSEGAGAQAIYATLTRSDTNQIAQAVRVRLAASAANQLILPDEITIPKYTMGVRFAIGVVDNALDDGDREVTINGAIVIESCGCSGQPSNGDVIQAVVGIIDNDGPALALKADPTTMKEGRDPAGYLTLSHNSTLTEDLTVRLWADMGTSSATADDEVEIPEYVIIPAGQTSVRIPVKTLDDGVEDGGQLVSVYVEDESGVFAPASTWVQVSDQNLPDLAVADVSAPSSVVAMEDFEVSFAVANTGFMPTSRAIPYVAYLVNGANASSYSSYLAKRTGTLTGGLAVDGVLSGSESFTAPELPGGCRVAVVVDPDNTITELDRSNNTRWSDAVGVGVAYTAVAAVATDRDPELGLKVFRAGETVAITGLATRADGTPAAGAKVDPYVVLNGMRRSLLTTTESDGTFAVTFTPSSGEAGNYGVGACYPGVNSTAYQDAFSVVGMSVASYNTTWDLKLGDAGSGSIVIRNRSSVPFTGLSVTFTDIPEECRFTHGSIPDVIPGNGSVSISMTATAVALTEQFEFLEFHARVSVAEGFSFDIPLYFHSQAQTAYLRATPGGISTTMAIGETRYIDITVLNDGRGDSGRVTASVPDAGWLKIVGGATIDNLASGESATITLAVSPTESDGLVLNRPLSGGNLAVNCANGRGTSVSLSFTPVSEATGGVTVDVADNNTYYLESAPHLAGATVRISNPYTGATVATGTTGANGIWSAANIPEGRYQLAITAPHHGSYADEVVVEPGRTSAVSAFLQYQLVSVDWTVEKVEIEDSYEIKLLLDFETQVPAPIVKTVMPSEFPQLVEGESYAFPITLVNEGVIAAEQVTVTMPKIKGYKFTLIDNDVKVPAKSSATIAAVLYRKRTNSGGSGSDGPDAPGDPVNPGNPDGPDGPGSTDDPDNPDNPDDPDNPDGPDGHDGPDDPDDPDDRDQKLCWHPVTTRIKYICGKEKPWYEYKTVFKLGDCRVQSEVIDQVVILTGSTSGGGTSGGGGSNAPTRIGGGTGGWIGGGTFVGTAGSTYTRRDCDLRMNDFADAAQVINDGLDGIRQTINESYGGGADAAVGDAIADLAKSAAWSMIPFSSCIDLVGNTFATKGKDGIMFKSYFDRYYWWDGALAAGLDALGCGIDVFTLGQGGRLLKWARLLGSRLVLSRVALSTGKDVSKALLSTLKTSKNLMGHIGTKALAKFTNESMIQNIFGHAESLYDRVSIGVSGASYLLGEVETWTKLYQTINGTSQTRGVRLQAAAQQSAPVGLLAPSYTPEQQLIIEDLAVATIGYAALDVCLDELIDKNDCLPEDAPSEEALAFVSACVQVAIEKGEVLYEDVASAAATSIDEASARSYIASLNGGVSKWMNNRSEDGFEEASDDEVNIHNVIRAMQTIGDVENYARRRGYEGIFDMWCNAVDAVESLVANRSDSVCASVKLQLSQTLAMTREAFDGTLTLYNGNTTTPVTNLKLDVSVLDEDGNECKDLFEIFANGTSGDMSDGSALAGGLSVAAGGTGSAMVRFIPERGAAPTEEKLYRFGGTVTYTDPFSGETATVKLTPVSLTVSPSPYLHLDYFVQRDVFADDPFTPDVVEASMPAELAVLVRNVGGGNANKVTIASAQPEMVQNEKGLSAAFNLKDYTLETSALNGATAHLGLNTVSLGTIEPNESKVAQWWLTSTIEGHFIGMSATVTPVNSWNTPDTMLVDPAVGVHKLVRSVVADGDTLPDFLVCDGSDLYGTPNEIYTARGDVAPVCVASVATCATLPPGGEIELPVSLTPAQSGWNYGYAAIPGIFRYTISRIVRGDGTEISLRNAWITDRTFRDGNTPLLEDRLHIVDEFASSVAQSYTVYLAAKPSDVPEVVAFEGVTGGAVEYDARNAVTVVFSKPIDPATFTADDLTLVKQGTYLNDLSSLAITPTDESNTRFTIDRLSGLCGDYGHYELTVKCAGIADTVGQLGTVGKSVAWTYATAEAPYVIGADGVPVRRVQSLDSIGVTFSTPVEPATFTTAALRLNGAAVGSDVSVAPLDETGTRFAVSGLSSAQSEDGEYELTVDATAVAGLDGTPGVDAYTAVWTRDTAAPVLEDVSRDDEVLGERRFILSFNEDVELASLTPDKVALTRNGAAVSLPASAEIRRIDDGGQTLRGLRRGGIVVRYALSGIDSALDADGTYELTFSANGVTDEAGNVASGSKSVTWTVDRTPPAQITDLAISPDGGFSDTDGITYTGALTVSGTLPEDGLTVQIIAKYFGGDETVLATLPAVGGDSLPAGAFSQNVVMPSAGNATLVVRLTDVAGNSSCSEKSVSVDGVALTGTLTGASDEKGVVTTTATLAFSAKPMEADVTPDKFSLTRDGEAVALEGVTFAKVDDTTYTLSGLEALCSEDGVYVLTFNGAAVRKYTSGLLMSGSQLTMTWRYENPDREPPTVTEVLFDGETPHEAYTNTQVFSSVSVTFSEAVNVPELIANGLIGRAARIDLLDAAGVATGCVAAVAAETAALHSWDAESNTLSLRIDPLAVPAGRTRLILDAGLIADLAGNHLAADGYAVTNGMRTYALSGTALAQVNAQAMPMWYNGELYVGEKTADGKGKIRHYAAGTAALHSDDWSYLQSEGVDIEIPAQGCQGASLAFADMDGDGVVETYVGTATGDVLKYPGGTVIASLGANRAMPYAYDIDGDGCDELVAGGMDGRIRVISRDATTGTYSMTVLTDVNGAALSVPNGRAAPVVADINHDGLADIVSGDTAGNVWAYLGAGGSPSSATAADAQGRVPPVFVATPVCVSTNSVGLADRSRLGYGDVNEDGIEDLIVGRSDGSVVAMLGAETPSPIVPFAVKAVVSASAGAHGAIAPVGDVTYDGGDTPEYTITPDVGYHVADVQIDGVSIGATNNYVFAPLTTSHTIHADFAIDTFAVTFEAGAHGALSGETAQTIDYGGMAVVPTVTPDVGYRFTGWSGDVSAPIVGNVTFTAQYATVPYAITYTGLKGATNTNPKTYTVEDAITFVAPGEVYGWVFKGWTPASIALGGTGAIEVAANWERQKFDVTVNGETWQYDYEEEAVFATNAVISCGATQYVCKGWAATNADPASGDGARAVFRVLGDVALDWQWETNVVTIAQAVNADALEWTTGGAAKWMPAWDEAAADGLHQAQCGKIPNGTNAWVSATVEGPGTMTFKWRSALASRNTKYQLMVDGEVKGMLTGTNEWADASVTVFGDRTHEIKWRLMTGRSGAALGDMAALDCVAWVPSVPPTLAEALNTNLVWKTDGDVLWRGVARESLTDSRDAWAVASGLGDDGSAAVQTRVYGSGVLTFDWSISCEEDYDWMELTVDGEVRDYISGEHGWTSGAVEIVGDGWHVVRWEFIKDELDDPELVGDNVAKLDNVAWASSDEPPAIAETQTTPVPVPYAELEGRFGSYLDKAGGDYEAAAKMTGRNGCAIWESYVAGLEPDDADSKFAAKIEMSSDGTPKVTWEPDNETLRATRTYTVYGKKTLLDDEWTPIYDGNKDQLGQYHFFKVTVGLQGEPRQEQ